MKYKERKNMCIALASRALVAVMDNAENNSSLPMKKAILIPLICGRVDFIVDNSNDTLYDEEAIYADEKFIWRNWSGICLMAFANFNKYIIPSRIGIRYGTWEEYQKIPNERSAAIVNGFRRWVARRTKLIVDRGGQSILLNVEITKQLPSGENKEEK